MMDTPRKASDELADLAAKVREIEDGDVATAVRELREEVAALRAERAAHTCHGHYGTPACFAIMSHAHCNWGHCWCWTVHGNSVTFQTAPALPQVWYGTVSSGTSSAVDGNGSAVRYVSN